MTSQDDHTLSGSPAPKTDDADGGRPPETDGGRSTSTGRKDGPDATNDGGVEASPDISEEAAADGGRSTRDDVGFPPVEPSSSDSVAPGIPSDHFREHVALSMVHFGRVIRGLGGLRVPENLKNAMERAAAIETANQICKMTENEMKRGER